MSKPRSRDAATGLLSPRRSGYRLIVLVASVTLAACVAPPLEYTTRPAPAPVQRPSTDIYFYPSAGQSAAQQDRDRYECYLWAVKQTGFDPSQAQLAPHQRVEVVPAQPPGQNTALGAVTGAMIGAMASRRHESFEGAVTGAMAGAVIGATADQANQEQAERVQRSYDASAAQQAVRDDRLAREYRRAMTACLEGRGYTVR